MAFHQIDALQGVVPFVIIVYKKFQIVFVDLLKETQMPGVDSDKGDGGKRGFVHSAQKSTVAADTDIQIGLCPVFPGYAVAFFFQQARQFSHGDL